MKDNPRCASCGGVVIAYKCPSRLDGCLVNHGYYCEVCTDPDCKPAAAPECAELVNCGEDEIGRVHHQKGCPLYIVATPEISDPAPELSGESVDVEYLIDEAQIATGEEDNDLVSGIRQLARRYYDLIYQVQTKHPDESRHDTAKRYIVNAETPKDNQACAKTPDSSRKDD